VSSSPDGRRLVSASQAQTARVWDVATGSQVLLLPFDDQLSGAAFSPDGQELAVLPMNGTVLVLRTRTP
jgi:WD40 repeat protein